MTIWTPNRIIGFLVVWNMLVPFRIDLTFTRSSVHYIIYAALWGYYPRGTPPFIEGPLVLSGLYVGFMFPYYVLGLVVAWFVWQATLDSNMTKRDYYERVLFLQILQTLILWVFFPCSISYSFTLCLPTGITGIIALPFVPRVVQVISSPWEDSGPPHGAWDTMEPESVRENIEVPRTYRVRSQIRRFIQSLHKKSKGME